MARLVVVVLVLLAIAVLVNKYLIGGGDPDPRVKPPARQQEAQSQEQAGGGDLELKPAEQGPALSAPASDTSNSDTPNSDTPASDTVTSAQAAEAAASDFDTAQVTAAVEQGAQSDAEEVLLGSAELTDGISGETSFTVAELEAWLADPKNHVVLKPQLPLGLAAGAAEIQGIESNPLTRAKIELGRQLYFDPRLSSDGTISCASCHAPEFGYAHETRFGVGVRKQEGNRNSPVAYNRILSGAQFWDGRAASLEDQAVGPIANAIEMGNTHEACVASLGEIPGYRAQFEAIFQDGLTIDNVGRALASFERAVVTAPAPWDYYQQLKAFEEAYAADLEVPDEFQEDDPELYAEYQEMKRLAEAHPISESAMRGGALFFSDKAGCTACHLGANFTDEKYHNLGVGMEGVESVESASETTDWGRFAVTKEEVDRGAFKTPTVRNVALTAPYMHDGSQKTLEEVVEWYAKGGHPNPWLSEKVKKLDLTDQDKADLVAFMKEGLTGELPNVQTANLPADGS
jgi:cytochrome c peroxidase